MAYYSDEVLNTIREANDLASVVGQYAPLKSRGRDLWCCCPLHHEKTPSFKINTATQTWYCFGCEQGGDVFSFVMKMEDLSFTEAVERLAERASIEITPQGGDRAPKGQKETLRQICTATAAFYHLQLMRSKSSDAALARSYLASRSLGGDIPKKWELGYAPGNNVLLNHLRSLGFSTDAMIAANVVVRSKSGVLRDRFYNRVMFPIKDVTGQCIAFGGRVLGTGEPKYLNSQETPLFHKSSVLYGLDQAKASMASTGAAVVVEGYTDVIALSKAGIENVVATLGTALTLSHIRLLSRHATQRIIYLFDGDSAGQRAADRALSFIDGSMTPEAGRVRVSLDAVILPDDLDPADFVAKRGADALRTLLHDAKPLLAFGIERRLAAHDLDTAEGRSAALTDALSVLAPIKDSLLAKDYAVQIAGAVRCREEDVLERLAALQKPQPIPGADSSSSSVRASEKARPITPEEGGHKSRRRTESTYLAMLSTHPSLVIEQFDRLSAIRWQFPLHETWAQVLLDTLTAKPLISSSELSSRIVHSIAPGASLLASASSYEDASAKELVTYLAEELELGDMEEAIATIRQQLARSEQLSAEDYENLFHKAVTLSQNLNARRMKQRL